MHEHSQKEAAVASKAAGIGITVSLVAVCVWFPLVMPEYGSGAPPPNLGWPFLGSLALGAFVGWVVGVIRWPKKPSPRDGLSD